MSGNVHGSPRGHKLLVGAAASILVCCSATGERVGFSREQIIYGDDSRHDVHEAESQLLKGVAIESTLALVSTPYLEDREDGTLKLTAPTLGEVLNLCPEEAFRAQPAAASCSGILIDDDLVLTAGHCVSMDGACDEARSWVSNYALQDSNTLSVLLNHDVYGCRSVVLRVREVDSAGQRWDFAVVELDRPVALPQRPVQLEDAPLSVGEDVSVIGYPNGLPVKIDDRAQVSNPRSACGDYFELTADTFEGSSGSGVFDSEARLVGMVVRGGVDYDYNIESQCLSARRRNGESYASAEHANYIAPVLSRLCASGRDSERLCPEGRARVAASSERQSAACTADPLPTEPEFGACAFAGEAKSCPSVSLMMGWALGVAVQRRRRSRTR